MYLRTTRRRFAGAERGSRCSHGSLMCSCGRVRATEDASRDPFCLLERRHGLVKIVERGASVHVERLRIIPPHLERGLVTLSEYEPRPGYRFAQQ